LFQVLIKRIQVLILLEIVEKVLLQVVILNKKNYNSGNVSVKLVN